MSAQLSLPWRSLTDLQRKIIYVVLSDIAESLGMSDSHGEGKLLERLKRNGEFLIKMDSAHFPVRNREAALPVREAPPPTRELPLPVGGFHLPVPVSGLPVREAPPPTRELPLPVGAWTPPVRESGFSPTGEFVWCTDYLGLTTAIWGSRSSLSEEVQAYWRGVITGIPFALAEALERENAGKLREAELQLQLQKQEHAAQLRIVEEVSPGTGQKLLSKEKSDMLKDRVKRIAAKTAAARKGGQGWDDPEPL